MLNIICIIFVMTVWLAVFGWEALTTYFNVHESMTVSCIGFGVSCSTWFFVYGFDISCIMQTLCVDGTTLFPSTSYLLGGPAVTCAEYKKVNQDYVHSPNTWFEKTETCHRIRSSILNAFVQKAILTVFLLVPPIQRNRIENEFTQTKALPRCVSVAIDGRFGSGRIRGVVVLALPGSV